MDGSQTGTGIGTTAVGVAIAAFVVRNPHLLIHPTLHLAHEAPGALAGAVILGGLAATSGGISTVWIVVFAGIGAVIGAVIQYRSRQ